MKILKWIGIVLASLVIIVIIAVVVLNVMAGNRLHKEYEITATPLAVPSDAESIAKGEHLVNILLCKECHGGALEGKEFFNEPPLATIYAPNLTSGEGGATASYSDEDWVRSIRHGVRPDGKPLFIMPSKEYHHLSEKDLASLIAYLKTVPPANKTWPENNYMLVGKVMLGLGAFGDVINAESIDHSEGFKAPVPEGTSTEYGNYLTFISGCRSCHGVELTGQKDPGNPDMMAPNITPGGNFGKWTQAQFAEVLRTGKTPEGLQLDEKFMPWTSLTKMHDYEIQALYNYLKSLPAKESAI